MESVKTVNEKYDSKIIPQLVACNPSRKNPLKHLPGDSEHSLLYSGRSGAVAWKQ